MPILSATLQKVKATANITELSGLGNVEVGYNWDRELMLMNGSLQTNVLERSQITYRDKK